MNKISVSKVSLARLIMAISLVSLPCFGAEDVESLKKENAELRERLDKLSNEMDEIKNLLSAQGMPVTTGTSTNKVVTSKNFGIQLYGMIKLDAAYDDSRTSIGNYARWVESESALNNDGQFSMTANQTQLGLLVNAPPWNDIKTMGRLEIDFYGAGTAENKPEAMLRHAYVNAEWLKWNFSLLAGQTSDVISPLTAPTVNYTVCWWQGNIGYRRPQIRLTKGMKMTDNFETKLEIAAARTIPAFSNALSPDPGADEEFPSAQARLSATFPIFDKKPATIGISGHWGEEERHVTNSVGVVTGHAHYDSWSANVDLKVPITSWLLLQAEGFIGDNLAVYLGGVGQGYNATQQDTIRAMGGWTALSIGPFNKWMFNTGAGVDRANPDDLTPSAAAPPRVSNMVCFGNTYYSITPNLQLALEISYLRTTYKQAATGDDWREQFSVIYKF